MMKKLFNSLSVFVLIGVSLAYFFEIDLSSKALLCTMLLETLLFVHTGKKTRPDVFTSWACPIYILLFSLLVVNFQTLTNVSLGLGTLGDYMFGSQGLESLISPCLEISVSSMSAFMLAVLNYRPKQDNVVINYEYSERVINILLIVAFLYFIGTINIRDFLTGAVYQGSGASDAGVASYGYSERFLDSIIFISLAIYSYNIRKNNSITTLREYFVRIPKIFWVVVGLYLVLRLFSGDRGPVIFIFFAVLYSCIYCIQYKIKLIYFLSICIVGAVIMAGLSYARAQSSDISFSEKMRIGNEMVTASGVPNISPFTQELAGSNICTLIMLNDINKGTVTYKYGSNVVSVLINCLPGMGIIKSILPFPDVLNVPASTTYITQSANGGKDYESGYGSTLVADYYYDLGLVGCILGFLFLGYIYMMISTSIVESRPLSVVSLIFIFKMASLSIYIPRSTMWASIGSTIFVLVIYYIVNSLFKIKR